MIQSHLEFFKSFFNKTHTDVEYSINNHIFYINKNIMFCDIHDMKYPLIIIGDDIWINFENDGMKYFKIILPYILELNIDFFYLIYEMFQEYPNEFFTTTTMYHYFTSIYDVMFIKNKYYNNGTNNYYDHNRFYNNRNKLLRFFEKHNYDWKTPLYRLIKKLDKRNVYFNMLHQYIDSDLVDHEMGQCDNYLRVDKLKEMMKMFESDEFNN